MSPEPSPVSTPARAFSIARRLATKSGVLAGVGIFGLTGVAAAAAGAPVPVLEAAFEDQGPTLVAVEDDATELGAGAEQAPEEEPAETEGGSEDAATQPAHADAEAVASDEASDDAVTEEGTKDTQVPDAARSDCFKPGGQEEENENDEEALEVTADPALEPVEDVDNDSPTDCPDETFKNHGEYVSDVAKQRNDERKAAHAEERADRKAAQADKKAERKAAQADKKAERKAAQADKKAERKAAGGDGQVDEPGDEETEDDTPE